MGRQSARRASAYPSLHSAEVRGLPPGPHGHRFGLKHWEKARSTLSVTQGSDPPDPRRKETSPREAPGGDSEQASGARSQLGTREPPRRRGGAFARPDQREAEHS